MSPQSSTLYNLNIERAVLSAIMFDPEKIESISAKLDASDFFLANHGRIFDVVVELYRSGKPVDDEFVRMKLIKGGDYVEEVFLEVCSSNPISNPDAYSDSILSMSRKRKLSTLGSKIKKRIVEDGEDEEAVIDEIQNQIESIQSQGFKLNIVNGNQLSDGQPEFRLKKWLPIPQSALTLISADGGVGKTWIVIQMAIRFIVENGYRERAFLWLSEDTQPVVRSRIGTICGMLGFGKDEYRIRECLHFETSEPPALVTSTGYKKAVISPIFRTLRQQLRGYQFIVFDPWGDFFGGQENEANEVSVFMKPFKHWAAETGASIIFLHHNNRGDGKGSSSFRGSSAIRTSVRMAYEMDFVRDQRGDIMKDELSKRTLKLTKDNWGGGKNIDMFINATTRKIIVPGGYEVVYENSARREKEIEAEEHVYMPMV